MNQNNKPPASSYRNIQRFSNNGGSFSTTEDFLSVEEPLEIILQHSTTKPFVLAVTMRTPGNDLELATGLLFSEGIIADINDIEFIEHNSGSATPENSVVIGLKEQCQFDQELLQRYSISNSACGICGKTAIQDIELLHLPELSNDFPKVKSELLCTLPEKLKQYQSQFSLTGGIHCAAIANSDGQILDAREDVGRHNALDKLNGHLLKQRMLPATDRILLLSGRASFELVQKALMANYSFIAAMGAPTSLARDLALRHNMTLVGFLKPDGFNVYCSPERII